MVKSTGSGIKGLIMIIAVAALATATISLRTFTTPDFPGLSQGLYPGSHMVSPRPALKLTLSSRAYQSDIEKGAEIFASEGSLRSSKAFN